MGLDITPGQAAYGTDLPGALQAASPASDAVTDTAAANTQVQRTYAAVAGQRHRLTMLAVSYSAAPAGGRIQITDGGTLRLDLDITAAGTTTVPIPAGGIRGAVNADLVLTLSAGGAAVIGKISSAKVTG